MAHDNYYNHLLITHTDWYQFLTNPEISDSDATAAYHQCAQNEPNTTVQLDILPFIWNKFDTKVWHEFLTNLIIQKLDTKFYHDSKVMTYLPEYLPSLKLCAPYIESVMARSSARTNSKVKLKAVYDILNGDKPSTPAGHLISLAFPELLDSEALVDSLIASSEWADITALPLGSLARILDAVEQDARFTEGSQNDLTLCGILAGWRCEGAVYDYFVPTHNNPSISSPAIRKLELVLTLAETNRYWRALVFNFYSNANYTHWREPCVELLNNYSSNPDNGFGGRNTLHSLFVMEEVSKGSSFTPGWVGNFLKATSDCDLSETSRVWELFVPAWRTNEPTWDALGMSHQEKVQACRALLAGPGTTSPCELPDTMCL